MIMAGGVPAVEDLKSKPQSPSKHKDSEPDKEKVTLTLKTCERVTVPKHYLSTTYQSRLMTLERVVHVRSNLIKRFDDNKWRLTCINKDFTVHCVLLYIVPGILTHTSRCALHIQNT